MLNSNPLQVYAPLNKRLLKIAIDNKFHKYVLTFSDRTIFKTYGKKVIKHLDSLSRPQLINEAVRFWYLFLLGKPTQFINEFDYYPMLTKYFLDKEIFRFKPMWYKPRYEKKYCTLVYCNNRFFFIKTFSSILEMELFFQIRIKIDKKDYIIKYK